MNIWILDDIYGEKIYGEVSNILQNQSFPIKKCVENPIPYLADIKDGDFIILDNYFPTEFGEGPIGDDFLRQYLKLGLKCKIICISNVGERIINRFEQRYKVFIQGDIVGFVPNKDGRVIANIIISKTNKNLLE